MFLLLAPSPFASTASLADRPFPVLRIAVARHTLGESRVSHFGPGFEQGLVHAFCGEYGYSPRWIAVDDQQEALRALEEERADLMAGFAGDAADPERLEAGPDYFRAGLPEFDLPEADPSAEAAFLPAAVPESDMHVWRPFLPEAGETRPLPPGGARGHARRWLWRADDPLLDMEMRAFWKQRGERGDKLLAQLDELHFGFLPHSYNPYDIEDLFDALRRRLPAHSGDVAAASREARIDPLFFTAVIFQESRFDPGTVSHTGVRGIMQLTADTAEFLKVDRLKPAEALRGGARYLRYLWDTLENLELEVWDRWFFVLAAFNQGPRRLEGAMELSRKLGGSGRSWQELKQVYPLLGKPEYAAMVGQGTCRGGEAVRFVESVRWYYHVLRSLVTLFRPEAKYLTPLLLSAAPGS